MRPHGLCPLILLRAPRRRGLLMLILINSVGGTGADRDVLHTALSPHRDLDRRTPDEAHQSEMTDHQFRLLLRHLQVMIAILGLIAGVDRVRPDVPLTSAAPRAIWALACACGGRARGGGDAKPWRQPPWRPSASARSH
jgi:hypothetical protein